MIKLIKSTFYNEEETKKSLCEFIKKTPVLSMNEQCRKFELAFSKKQQRKYGVMVNSGSSANLILIQSLLNIGKLMKGDLVAVSALTWSTNIMPLIQLGLRVILVDCEINTLNVSLSQLKKKFDNNKKIKMFFLTNTLGLSDNISEIQSFCFENNILLIEDNCESLGSKVKSKLLGNYGFGSTFSFFVGHHLSTIEGGMVCTDDKLLYNSLVMTRSHGWDRNLSNEEQTIFRKENNIEDFYSKYTFYDLAFNVRPSEINGFLGNEQLKFLDEMVEKRFSNFMVINKAIQKNDDLLNLTFDHMDILSSFAIPIITKSKQKQLAYRDKFIKAQIETRPMIAGNMALQPFYKKHVKKNQSLPNAEFLHKNSFYCGNNPELTKQDLERIIDVIS